MKSKRNIYLDLLKLFAAYCVIFIHINTQVKAPTKISFPYAAIMAFVRFAVPLFFITSGYFSYKISSDRIKTRLKRTGILILISTIIYFAWSCFQERILLGHSLHKYLDVALSYKNLADFVFLEQNPFGVHLWYLNALFVIYVVFYFYTALQKNEQKPKYRPLYIIAATLFCVFNLVSVKLLANKHELPYLTYRNSCLMGLPFFATGLFLRQYRDRIFEKFKLKKTTLIVAIIACIAISAVQVIAYGKPTECPPFIAIAAVLLFLLCFKLKPSRILEKIPFLQKGFIDKLYLNIYINHVIFLRLFMSIAPKYPLAKSIVSHRLSFWLVDAALSTATAILFVLISNSIQKLTANRHSKSKALK